MSETNRTSNHQCLWIRLPDVLHPLDTCPVRFYIPCIGELAHGAHAFYPDACPHCKKRVAVASSPDETTGDTAYVIHYEDRDRLPEHFSGYGATEAARARYESLQDRWSCHLFKRITPEKQIFTETTGQQPVAWVPIHPRSGPLWANTVSSKDADRPKSYPLMPLFAIPPEEPTEPEPGLTAATVAEMLRVEAAVVKLGTCMPPGRFPEGVSKYNALMWAAELIDERSGENGTPVISENNNG